MRVSGGVVGLGESCEFCWYPNRVLTTKSECNLFIGYIHIVLQPASTELKGQKVVDGVPYPSRCWRNIPNELGDIYSIVCEILE